MSNKTPLPSPATGSTKSVGTGGPSASSVSSSRGMAFDRSKLYAQSTQPAYAYATGEQFRPPAEASADDIALVNASTVPPALVWGVIAVEMEGHGMIERLKDAVGKALDKSNVSLGLGQIQLSRAVELDNPGRDFNKQPVTPEEQQTYEERLEDPHLNINYVVAELASNFAWYGRSPGKTTNDQWRFALAKHKGGHGAVGPAQVAASAEGGDSNAWRDVAPHLDAKVRTFAERIAGGADPAPVPIAVV